MDASLCFAEKPTRPTVYARIEAVLSPILRGAALLYKSSEWLIFVCIAFLVVAFLASKIGILGTLGLVGVGLYIHSHKGIPNDVFVSMILCAVLVAMCANLAILGAAVSAK